MPKAISMMSVHIAADAAAARSGCRPAQHGSRRVAYCAATRLVLAFAITLALNASLFADHPLRPAPETGTASEMVLQAATATLYDPFDTPAASLDPFDNSGGATPVQYEALPSGEAGVDASGAPTDTVDAVALDPCGAAVEKPLASLTIAIGMPAGEIPDDFAAQCAPQVHAMQGPIACRRPWSLFTYHWDPTCLCHRPLYFEEINLERHGYGCHECLQPAASAAHFFATVPALPYCIVAECPTKCVYTLGHYRPGSCPPRRCNWPL